MPIKLAQTPQCKVSFPQTPPPPHSPAANEVPGDPHFCLTGYKSEDLMITPSGSQNSGKYSTMTSGLLPRIQLRNSQTEREAQSGVWGGDRGAESHVLSRYASLLALRTLLLADFREVSLYKHDQLKSLAVGG